MEVKYLDIGLIDQDLIHLGFIIIDEIAKKINTTIPSKVQPSG